MLSVTWQGQALDVAGGESSGFETDGGPDEEESFFLGTVPRPLVLRARGWFMLWAPFAGGPPPGDAVEVTDHARGVRFAARVERVAANGCHLFRSEGPPTAAPGA